MNRRTKEWIELEKLPPVFSIREKEEPKIHLFVKGENKVVCAPRHPMGDKIGTTQPSKVTCRNCVTKIVRTNKRKTK